jgi:hypothetical protein
LQEFFDTPRIRGQLLGIGRQLDGGGLHFEFKLPKGVLTREELRLF